MISSPPIHFYAPSSRQYLNHLEPDQFVVELDCRGPGVRLISGAGPQLQRENTAWYRFTRSALVLAKDNLQATTGTVHLQYGYQVTVARELPRLDPARLPDLSLSRLGDMRSFEAYLESEARTRFLRGVRALSEHERAMQALDQLIDMPVVYYPELLLEYRQRKTAVENVCDSLMAALATFCDERIPLYGGLVETMFWTYKAELEPGTCGRLAKLEVDVERCLKEYWEHVRERENAAQAKMALVFKFLERYQPDVASLGPLIREFLPMLGPQIMPDHVGDVGRRIGGGASHAAFLRQEPEAGRIAERVAGAGASDSIQLSACAAGQVLASKLREGMQVVDAMVCSLESVQIRTRRNKSLSESEKDHHLRNWLDNNADALEEQTAQQLLADFLLSLGRQNYVVEPAGTSPGETA